MQKLDLTLLGANYCFQKYLKTLFGKLMVNMVLSVVNKLISHQISVWIYSVKVNWVDIFNTLWFRKKMINRKVSN